MRQLLIGIGGAALGMAVLGAVAWGEGPATPGKTDPASAAQVSAAAPTATAEPPSPIQLPETAGAPAQPHDPTVPSGPLRAALEKSRQAGASARSAETKAPEITLRGRIQVAGKPPQAVIEVGTALYIIATGSRMTVDSGHGQTMELRVGAITLEEIEIELPALRQTVVIR